MSFRVSARTVLELGAELISSDSVAIYELVKNAIDARSPTGVDLHFQITLGHTAFRDAMADLEGDAANLDSIKDAILQRIESTAQADLGAALRSGINECTTVAQLVEALPRLYEATSFITFADTGHGMTLEDLEKKFLVIGTPARKVENDLANRTAGEDAWLPAPYLGEKGVGRLSAMRLGHILEIKTATKTDSRINLLRVDWQAFHDPSLFIEDVDVAPTVGDAKPDPTYQGTSIRISGLEGNWTTRRIRESMSIEIARLRDPFGESKKSARLAVYFNGTRIELPRLDADLLAAAHASVKASYRVQGGPCLTIDMAFKGPERTETRQLTLRTVELAGATSDDEDPLPRTALLTMGPFDFEAYWYNRQRMAKVDSIGDRATTRRQQAQWSGIMLFRDGYRVFPYGSERDDWLGLDRKALGSPGYKLNKAQFIGRVRISRLLNPNLIDQTSREGLKDCSEKRVLLALLSLILTDNLKRFMDEVQNRQKHVDVDLDSLDARIGSLHSRATAAVRELKTKHKGSTLELKDIQVLFDEMYAAFELARRVAEQAQDEQERLLHLAGIGLMLEVVAHELARSTEAALKTLAETPAVDLPSDLASMMKTLRAELVTMNKRLRVLDPLSVSGRQRKETFDLLEVVRECFAARARQFDREHIETRVPPGRGAIVHGVKGMFVQIIENLTSNSTYWLGQRKKYEPSFHPRIEVSFDPEARTLSFTDNGPGISDELREEVFKAFFSTKDQKRRQGLGLYIARECAIRNDSSLDLSWEHTEHDDRYNTFELTLPAVKV
jgi:signal transduction histidine kinase